jgi:hypothetical protein
MAEEREIPTLDELVTEIEGIVERLDKDHPAGAPVDPAALMSEIKNTVLPLMKDLAASTALGFVEIQDIVDPIKLSGADAEEVAALLKAFAQTRPTDAALQERIGLAMEALEQDDEEGDEEEETN